MIAQFALKDTIVQRELLIQRDALMVCTAQSRRSTLKLVLVDTIAIQTQIMENKYAHKIADVL